MAALLGDGTLVALTDCTATGLSTGGRSSGVRSAIASFKVGDSKAILAVGLDSADYAVCTTTTLTIPMAKAKIKRAERIDLDGSHVTDITRELVPDGPATRLKVSTRETPGSDAGLWNGTVSGNSDLAVFYVRLTLAP